ncbi:hypothetical protein [Streptomyces sp. NPDC054940]
MAGLLKTKDDEEILVVPSQIRSRIPGMEGVAGEIESLHSMLETANGTPVEGDSGNETYQAMMEFYGKSPKVVEGFQAIGQYIRKFAETMADVATSGEKAEQYAKENMVKLDSYLPEVAPVSVPPMPPPSEKPKGGNTNTKPTKT